MSELKVVHLLGGLFPSGMERMLASAARDFEAEGISCIIVGQGSEHPFYEALIDTGYEVRIIPSVRTLAGCRALAQILLQQRPHIVHIHTESAFLPAVLTSYLSGRPRLVRTIHSVFRPQGKASYSRRIQGLVADRFIARFVSPSPDVAKNELYWKRDSQIIYNWVSSDYISAGLNQSHVRNPLHAVLVGNCATVKNHEFALAYLLANGYTVAHHGNEAHASPQELRMLDDLADDGRLQYRGTEAPLASLQSAGVFVLPSLHEGMSVALAEAIAAGTPCLVADSIGLSWAKGIDGVEHIALDDRNEWARVFPGSGYVPVGGSNPAPDLSPQRGAAEYSQLYRRILVGSGHHTQN